MPSFFPRRSSNPHSPLLRRASIVRADALGMCFGVRDALTAIDELATPADSAVHGELVHNELVLEDLRQRGIQVGDEVDREELPEVGTLVVTAHGISNKELARLQESGREIVDTTCPLVRKAHDRALALHEEGRFVVVIGKPGHVEVRGLVGDLEDYAIVRNAAAVENFGHERLGVVCQTTTPDALVTEVLDAIRTENPGADIRFVDTVCAPTRDRQRAVVRLIEECDLIVVVGGPNSNNTKALVERCLENGRRSFRVATPDEIDPTELHGALKIGLTAGTSALPEQVDRVEKRLRELIDASRAH